MRWLAGTEILTWVLDKRCGSAFDAGVGVEVLEASRLDAGRLDEGVDIGELQPDHPAQAVGGELPLVDEPVERTSGDAQPASGFLRRQPHGIRRRCSILG